MDYLNQTDLRFLLFDWLKSHDMQNRERYADHDRETLESVLDLAAQLARETFAPHFKLSDQQEPELVDGKVVLPPETQQDLEAYREAGFFAAPFGTEVGGINLPLAVSMAAQGNFHAANAGTAGYAMLTAANARLLLNFANERIIETWALPEIEGRYFGTMCLSEPGAGSSLGDIRTRADYEAQDDFGDRYRLRGNKMWISGGSQEMSENIVHLVLAKVPSESGELVHGVKGISIFLVPKILPDGQPNDVAVAGLNHKMGYRGTVNCALNFGENEGAIGWRIGDEGQGLAIMFQMMNEARIGVGTGAACMAYRGYVQSTQYARERLQGRALAERDPASPQIPIIEHADVKRMLLAQKAIAEGALALTLYCAQLADDADTHPDETVRKTADVLLSLLTPVAKSWPSEFGVIANDLAIQVHGGYGYTRDFDVEQLYRDNRLNPIHEGTFGIQAADLVGRKLGQHKGAGYQELMKRMLATCELAKAHTELKDEVAYLTKAIDSLQTSVIALAQKGAVPEALDNAGAFLSAFGHVVVGWLWVSQTLAVRTHSDPRFSAGKLAACRYFLRIELPKASVGFEQVTRGEDCFASLDSSLL